MLHRYNGLMQGVVSTTTPRATVARPPPPPSSTTTAPLSFLYANGAAVSLNSTRPFSSRSANLPPSSHQRRQRPNGGGNGQNQQGLSASTAASSLAVGRDKREPAVNLCEWVLTNNSPPPRDLDPLLPAVMEGFPAGSGQHQQNLPSA